MYRPPVRMVTNYYQSRLLLLRMKRWPQPRRQVLRCKIISQEAP